MFSKKDCCSKFDEIIDIIGESSKELDKRVRLVENDIKGLYLFISAYIERVGEDEESLKNMAPELKKISESLKLVVKGLKNEKD